MHSLIHCIYFIVIFFLLNTVTCHITINLDSDNRNIRNINSWDNKPNQTVFTRPQTHTAVERNNLTKREWSKKTDWEITKMMTNQHLELNCQRNKKPNYKRKRTNRPLKDQGISIDNTSQSYKASWIKWDCNSSIQKNYAIDATNHSSMNMKINFLYMAFQFQINKIQIIWNILEQHRMPWRKCLISKGNMMNLNHFWECYNLNKIATFWNGCYLSVWLLLEWWSLEDMKILNSNRERLCKHILSRLLCLLMNNPLPL